MDGNILVSQELIQGIEATLNSIVFLVGITALVILIYAVISLLGNRRQARALEETRDIELGRLHIPDHGIHQFQTMVSTDSGARYPINPV